MPHRLSLIASLALLAAVAAACGDGDDQGAIDPSFVGVWRQSKSPDAVAFFLEQAVATWPDDDSLDEVGGSPLAEEVRDRLTSMGLKEMPANVSRRLELLRRQLLKSDDEITIGFGGSVAVRHRGGATDRFVARERNGALQLFVSGEAAPIGVIRLHVAGLELRLLDSPAHLWERAGD